MLIRKIDVKHAAAEPGLVLRKEWLLTNGLGGYASGTISGSVNRRYHAWLVAALPAPFGRTVMLNHLAEYLHLPNGRRLQISGEEPGDPPVPGAEPAYYLTEFRLESQLPVWRYEVHGVVLEKRGLLIHGQNTVCIQYHLLSRQEGVTLELRPSVHFRGHEAAVSEPQIEEYRLLIVGPRYEIASELFPPLRLLAFGEQVTFTHEGSSRREAYYAKEAERGYEARGHLWSPGYFSLSLTQNRATAFVASTELWETVTALQPDEAYAAELERHQRLIATAAPQAQEGLASELVLAADQFIITPAGRIEDAARARAAGTEFRTVIAGYHWFTDWGRDTMISLEGLTLSTGRFREAEWILNTFGHYIRDGLIPNLFPEGQNEGLYHTADATLWFFHALDRYLEVTGDVTTHRWLLPKLLDILQHHLRGTKFGIQVDPADGLLRQGAPGYQLTWMDAKVEDWVVTPRRGKAVEINALWYNALKLAEGWLQAEEGPNASGELAHAAERVRQAFNQRFWYAEGNYLYDVVDGEHGDDPACRPNQVLAISLRHPVLDPARWEPVLQVVRERLLTSVGLRSLSRDHRDYQSKYFGDLRARDAAYHQGTVWAWLIGPFIDAWLKLYPQDRAGARQFLSGFDHHLDDACIGTISEIFDAESPFTPRGCVAQAWSVAEVLRCLVKTAT